MSIDGDAWEVAELSDPLPGPDGGAALDAWRQWRYRYNPPEGNYEVVVHAVDGTGELQPEEESDAFPSGPTGWVSETIG